LCDTFVALGSATPDGATVFGKNSDRPYNEVQNIQYYPSREYSRDATVKCTYIEIPQASKTLAIFLSQPAWMFGGEMGANEKGVVIGNEAIWTREPDGPTALLGMDLLRLGLERGETAEKAMEVIVSLLEAHGQGGGCSEGDSSFTYHNSFLIADAREAWILETADKWWVAERVKDGIRNISNAVSIETQFDRKADGIVEYAVEKGYCRDDSDFNFAKCFASGEVADYDSQFCREGRGYHLLKTGFGKITPKTMMSILRDHEAGICMHGGFRSTASQVSLINAEDPCHVHWFTGTPHPCASFFKPFVFETTELAEFFSASARQESNKLWWQHEMALSKSTRQVTEKLQDLEEKFYKQVIEAKECSVRLEIQNKAIKEERQLYESTLGKI